MLFRLLRGAALPVLVALLILGAAWSALWYWASGYMLQEWRHQLQLLRAQGVQVEAGTPVRAGWPTALGLDVPEVRADVPDTEFPGGVAWTAQRLAVRIEALHPATLLFLPDGAQSLRLGALPAMPYVASALRIAAPLLDGGAGGRWPVLLRARQLRTEAAAGAVGGSAQAWPVVLTGVAARLEAGRSVFVQAERIEAPGLAKLPPVAPFLLEAGLTEPPPPSPAAADGADPLHRLARWRDAGGALLLRRLELRWGSMDASAEGRAGLDERLQPTAEGKARLRGAAEGVSTLAAAGYLNPGQATAMRAMLGLLARPPTNGGGGPAEAELPFSLRDGILSMGRMPLARVTFPGWPTAAAAP